MGIWYHHFISYWKPASSVNPKALVFLSHGFSEHLGMYQQVPSSVVMLELLLLLQSF